MIDQKSIEDFIENVNFFVTTHVDDLIQNKKTQENGVLIFNELKPGFQDFQAILSRIKPENLIFLPDFKFHELDRRLKPLFQMVSQIQNMPKNPAQPDEQQKRGIIHEFTRDYNAGNPNASGFFVREKDTVWEIIVQSITLANEGNRNDQETIKIMKKVKTAEKEVDEIRSKLNSILNSAQTELSKTGVGHHADIFTNQAKIHKENAKQWNNRAIKLLILTIFLATLFFIIIAFFIDPDKTKSLIETSVLAALLISFATYAFTLALRNYFAEKHNESINQHKANCLSTFNTFVDSADQERKAAILLQASQTIFSHQSSGFLTKENDIQNPNPIVEIVRNISSK
jgi:hypothetical protein